MIKYILFDLDETLYPRGAGLMKEIGHRISLYMKERMGLDPAQVSRLRREYYERYGTTMRGLQINYEIDPDDYLSYVHDIPLEEYIQPNGALDLVLNGIELEKIVFTNASEEHARRVLRVLGIERHFSRIVDIRAVNYLSKPNLKAYQRILDILGATGGECLIVEDNIRNLREAKKLGMITILVDGDPDESVDFVIEDVTEVGRVVRELQSKTKRDG